MPTIAKYTLLIASIFLFACQDNDQVSEPKNEHIRGLKAMTIETPSTETYRHYPSVLKASERSSLSFEISGKLGKNNLDVGQHVSKGDVLLALDKTTLQLNVEQASAALEQAKASLTNIESDLKRQLNLFEKKIITQAIIDKAKTNQLVAKSQVRQLTSQLETAQEQLTKSALVAPYDGIITSVNKSSYITVQAGETIATIYNPNSFEAQISVSYDVVQFLSIGKKVVITLADNPNIKLNAYISELASSTDVASSYPVIIHISEVTPDLRVGMSVEASIAFEVTSGDGFIIPLTAIITDTSFTETPNADPLAPINAEIFIYHPASATVNKQTIKMAGIKDNNVIVVDGLKRGDVVATAGVSFLTNGQKVKLLSNNK